MTMTVRDFVHAIQREIRDESDLLPDPPAQLLTKFTALLGNIAQAIREADLEYAKVLLGHLESDEAASRAKIRAEVSPEYQRKREARDLRELAQELIRSLKYYLTAKRDEFYASKHM